MPNHIQMNHELSFHMRRSIPGPSLTATPPSSLHQLPSSPSCPPPAPLRLVSTRAVGAHKLRPCRFSGKERRERDRRLSSTVPPPNQKSHPPPLLLFSFESEQGVRWGKRFSEENASGCPRPREYDGSRQLGFTPNIL